MEEELGIQVQARNERRRWTARLWTARAVVGALILLVWEGLGGTGLVDRFWISSPSQVGGRLLDMAASGALLTHLWASLEVALYGLALGMTVGIFLGVVLGLVPRVAAVLDPYIMILYTLPRIALAPLFIMYLGVGVISKVALTFTIVVFVALLNTYEGVRAVDPTLIDMLRTMRASRWRIVQWVVLPSVVPWILATVRIAIGLALVGAVVAELISSSRGLGWYMQRSAGVFDVTGVFTGMLILAVAAAVMNGFVTVLERRLLAWRSA